MRSSSSAEEKKIDKALYWDHDGFILLYKRIENGHLQWPRNQEEVTTNEPGASLATRRIIYSTTQSDQTS